MRSVQQRSAPRICTAADSRVDLLVHQTQEADHNSGARKRHETRERTIFKDLVLFVNYLLYKTHCSSLLFLPFDSVAMLSSQLLVRLCFSKTGQNLHKYMFVQRKKAHDHRFRTYDIYNRVHVRSSVHAPIQPFVEAGVNFRRKCSSFLYQIPAAPYTMLSV